MYNQNQHQNSQSRRDSVRHNFVRVSAVAEDIAGKAANYRALADRLKRILEIEGLPFCA